MTQPEPSITFDPRLGSTGRYRVRGRIISAKQARGILDRTLQNAEQPVKELSTMLRNGTISLEDWRLQMRAQIKASHLAAAAMQKGGLQNMTQADYGRVGAIVKRQYEFLEGFTQDVASGKQRLDGTLQRRAEQYTKAARGTYHRFEQITAVDRGMTEERSILGIADHCPECVLEAAKGWQPIGQMKPIGERICLKNCQCSVEYRGDNGASTAD